MSEVINNNEFENKIEETGVNVYNMEPEDSGNGIGKVILGVVGAGAAIGAGVYAVYKLTKEKREEKKIAKAKALLESTNHVVYRTDEVKEVIEVDDDFEDSEEEENEE